jgi:hypothetical protein
MIMSDLQTSMGDGPGILQMIVCLRDGNLKARKPQAEAVEQLKASYPSPEEATRKNVALPQWTSGLAGEFKSEASCQWHCNIEPALTVSISSYPQPSAVVESSSDPDPPSCYTSSGDDIE